MGSVRVSIDVIAFQTHVNISVSLMNCIVAVKKSEIGYWLYIYIERFKSYTTEDTLKYQLLSQGQGHALQLLFFLKHVAAQLNNNNNNKNNSLYDLCAKLMFSCSSEVSFCNKEKSLQLSSTVEHVCFYHRYYLVYCYN